MSALVGVAACLCALSVFVATGLERADALKFAEAFKREAVLVVAAARSMVDTLATRLKGTLGAGGPAQVSLGGKNVAWMASEVSAWMNERIAARGQERAACSG